MWPLFFWIAGPLSSGEFKAAGVEEKILDLFLPIRRELALETAENIKERFGMISKAIEIGAEIIASGCTAAPREQRR